MFKNWHSFSWSSKLSCLRKPKVWVFLLVLSLAAFLTPFQLVDSHSQESVIPRLSQLEEAEVGILLGTSKYRPGGGRNLFYRYRVMAAVQLFEAGKIQHILISGDNAHRSYDEPTTILKDLLKAGIPRSSITLDYAGFRTWDSIIRANKVFGLDRYIIISQDFHLRRALYISHQAGHQAQGFPAQTPRGASHLKMLIREHFARILLFWDILIQREPKFLGQVEPIQIQEEIQEQAQD